MRRLWICMVRLAHWLTLIIVLAACSLHDLVGGSVQSPYSRDPAVIKNKEGAISLYNAVQILFAGTFGKESASDPSYINVSGILSDELQGNGALKPGFFATSYYELLDSRNVWNEMSGSNDPYSGLQEIRGRAVEGIGALQKYAKDLPSSYTGYLYALKAYAELLLAEFYCSGVPLSEPVFEGDYYLTPGYSTDSVVRHALALFDTAAILAADSARILHLIQVGKGRAWLSVGEYARAEAAVKGVPDDYVYDLRFPNRSNEKKYVPTTKTNGADIADTEGGNGLPFRSSGDPRLALPQIRDPLAPLPVASGVEARLVEAETALQTRSETTEWLSILNKLRTTCTDVANCPSPAPAGTGGVTGLPPLTDPGTRDAQIDLVFRERAYWLFLTGHRQGDLRRLVRVYGRPRENVYPVGPWGIDGITSYGNAISALVPDQEGTYNPRFQGCVDE